MASPLLLVYWEGGDIIRASLREWWRFIVTPPNKMVLPNPGRSADPRAAKCFAGVQLGNRYFGCDFIIARLQKSRGVKASRWRCNKMPEQLDEARAQRG